MAPHERVFNFGDSPAAKRLKIEASMTAHLQVEAATMVREEIERRVLQQLQGQLCDLAVIYGNEMVMDIARARVREYIESGAIDAAVNSVIQRVLEANRTRVDAAFLMQVD